MYFDVINQPPKNLPKLQSNSSATTGKGISMNFTLRMQINRGAQGHWSSQICMACTCKCAATFWTGYDQRVVMQVSIASLIANLGFLLDCCVVSALDPLLVRMLQILP